ncbi:MAG TPA: efflux RND transporter permease subunit [Rhizomicrobium sp.]|nr:efflux RND transporter permease subunit [Rhizomicrobium sp.]
MNLVQVFIQRRIATTLLALGLGLAGFVAYFLLPVSPYPNIDIPTIQVSATVPGASPENMAATVATPLERHLGAIAGVTEMTSRSNVNSTSIVLQFDIDRDIDGAARDVQAAINAARQDLPASLRSNPTYRKFNPADQPVIILALTSKSLSTGQIYDQASDILQQKLSQIAGVGDVELNGASLPAIRIELNPRALFQYGIGLEDVRAAVSNANANSPKGDIQQQGQSFEVFANDTATLANDYKTLIIAYRNNAAVRLQDVAQVIDGVENVRNLGTFNGKPAILVNVTKQPGANVIQVVDNIRAQLPALKSALPVSIDLGVLFDTTTSIRNAVHDVEMTLILSTILVIVVVFLFLRNFKATMVPTVCVPLSLLGTFGVMYLLGFSLDNFSLMALIVSTGFVVDNTIVVLENVTRHLENGEDRLTAALKGSSEVSFTVISMSISLVAVFFPVLLLGGLVGRIFHEFAITVTTAIVTSLIVSLTVTPMMCAYLDFAVKEDQNALMRFSRRVLEAMQGFYQRTLAWSLGNPKSIMVLLLIAVVLNFYLLAIVPKGFFPDTDNGMIFGGIRGDQSISFQSMQKKFQQFIDIIKSDPAVATVGGFAGGQATNSGQVFVTLKPLRERGISTPQVIDRMRPKLLKVAGARLFLQSGGGIRAGGRQGNGDYQYTVLGDELEDLNTWVPKITDALQNVPELQDANSDQQDKGLEVDLNIDRASAARLGLNAAQIDNALYDAFGQRQVSTIYKDKNQSHVVMEVAPRFWQSPDTLRDLFISTSGANVTGTQGTAAAAGAFVVGNGASSAASSAPALGGTASISSTSGATSTLQGGSSGGGAAAAASAADANANALRNQQLNSVAIGARGGSSTGSSISTSVEKMVPLSAFATYGPGTTPLQVNHQGVFVATTFSFNLPPGVSMGQALNAIQRTMTRINVPISIHGETAGTAQLFQKSLSNMPFLLLAAILTIYITLGVLYESLIHPITILSTLPSAGVGAVLALLMFHAEFDLIAMIGVILLIGIVKKNAIIMIDFAIDLQRREGLSPRDAIYKACLLRFRPIMMTTTGAILGALPLAIGLGEGSELRQPLGISIVGGLLLSQVLTLYTTPVMFLYMDRFGSWTAGFWNRWYHGIMGDKPEDHAPSASPSPAE